MKHARIVTVVLLLAFLLTPAVWAQDETQVYDIPYVGALTPNGLGDQWKSPGLEVNVMLNKMGRAQPPENFDPRFRLGWNEEGLCLYLAVRDDIREESQDMNNLWDRDAAEIFVAKKRGSREMTHLVVTPGHMPGQEAMRSRFYGPNLGAPSKEWKATLVSAGARNDLAYSIEAVLPWSNLGIEAKDGAEIGFQLFIEDGDKTPSRFQANWFPKTRTHENPNAMYALRLTKKPSAPVTSVARGDLDNYGRYRLSVTAGAADAGKPVEVQADGKTLGAGVLLASNGRSSRTFYFTLSPGNQPKGPLAVSLGGAPMATLTAPNADDLRVKFLLMAPIVFDPYVFKGSGFPQADFADPVTAQNCIGPYVVRTTYYDKNFQPVTTAQEPGRYGAVVEIVPENGQPIRRFRTLFKMPPAYENVNFSYFNSDASVVLPPELGIDPAVIESQSGAIGHYVHRLFEDALISDFQGAALLAGLSEAKPPMKGDAVRVAENAKAADRQWWVDFKRRMYATDKEFAAPFVCPKPIEGAPAPELRKGSAKAAGMKPGVVKQLDAVCKAWAEESKEPFAVCVARNGVVFFHDAYGTRDGQPMTVTTKSWMASISKLLGGTQMMMLVDQGLVDLDTPIDRYLPSFRNIPVETPITIRHLFTHTAGTNLGITQKGYYPDHWGDEFNDLEESISEVYPNLKVGKAMMYNGLGYAIAGKIMEQVTGECQPRYAKNHLLDPLGCENTDIIDMSAYTRSVPMDIAKIGQMLLNKGAYGNMRFFSEATFEKMMPQKLTKILGPDTDVVWGIGAVPMPEKGLSPKTFAHGAASSATFRIDPENKLVIVMTRNTAGPKYADHYPKFIAAIVDNMEKDATK